MPEIAERRRREPSGSSPGRHSCPEPGRDRRERAALAAGVRGCGKTPRGGLVPQSAFNTCARWKRAVCAGKRGCGVPRGWGRCQGASGAGLPAPGPARALVRGAGWWFPALCSQSRVQHGSGPGRAGGVCAARAPQVGTAERAGRGSGTRGLIS